MDCMGLLSTIGGAKQLRVVASETEAPERLRNSGLFKLKPMLQHSPA